MNPSRRVFDDISQLIGSREDLPADAVAVCISPDNAFKYASHYAPRLADAGVPTVAVTA